MAVRSAWSRAARAAGRRLGPHAAVDILQSGHRLGVNVVHSNTIKAAVGTMLSDVTPVAAERLGQLVHGAGSEHPTSLTVALVALYGRMGDHRKAFAAFRDGPWRGATPGTWSPHLCRALLEAFGRRTMVDDEQTYGQEHLSEVAFRLAEFVFQQYLRGVSSITPGDSRQDIWHLVALQMSVCGRTAINPLPRASRLLQQVRSHILQSLHLYLTPLTSVVGQRSSFHSSRRERRCFNYTFGVYCIHSCLSVGPFAERAATPALQTSR